MRLPDPHSSYAVLIGTSIYHASKLSDLPAVRNNLDVLANILTAPASGVLEPERCHVVPEPTEVRGLWRVLRGKAAAAEDLLLVYFAGHGLIGPYRNDLYLALADTDPDELPVSALAFDRIREVFLDSSATNRVLILDCCFSGRAIPDMSHTDEAVLNQIDIQGTYILTAASANSVALAPAGAKYTAFTGELITLLHTGVPDGPELLTLRTIYQQLRRTMQARGLPQPKQRGTDTADLLALARNPAYRADNPAHRAGNRNVVVGLFVRNKDLGREREIILRYRWFCRSCNRGGELVYDRCPKCGAPTTRTHRAVARFRVPARPTFGERIRLAGFGLHDDTVSPAGDLYVELRQGSSHWQRLRYAATTPWKEQRTSGESHVGDGWVSSGGLKFRFR